ncbi:MAG: quinone-dependent dihydroorotate dehydrogenase [Candidatus Promineofilum sp.]|nr:quinone-dependent dihydroorotate dehydrogenase [Promineifilum sp.]
MNKSYYEKLFFPAIRHLDPEMAHDRTLNALELAQSNSLGRAMLRSIAGEVPVQPVQVGRLHFPNPLGIAAGFDKDARVVRGLALLGFGHIEVGTLTPRPQPGNPRPRIFRLPADGAVINRMGFPNGGVAAAVPRLRALAEHPHDFVLGVSLGKQKETPLADAAGDYIAVMRAVHAYADYLAVNISSPNTPGLRELQGGRYLERLLGALVAENRGLAAADKPSPPLWVKVAPDLEPREVDEIMEALVATGVDGIIVANTTLARDGLADQAQSEAGGLSGRPLRERATELIGYIHQQMGDALPIIGVGGVGSAAEAREKLDAGATVVQIYTSMIYGGPGLPGRILRDLAG